MDFSPPLGVIPVLVGPLQSLIAILPGLLLALASLGAAMFRPSTFKRLALLLWAQRAAVLVLVLVVGSVIYFLPGLLARPLPPASDAETSDTAWPAWRGGAARLGATGSAADPVRGKINWTFGPALSKGVFCSPAVVGNRVYVTSVYYEGSDIGRVYAVDADTGQLVWEFGDEIGYRSTFSSPAVEGKYLVVGEGLHQTRDARVVCLDVEQSERDRRGKLLWQYRAEDHVESSPAIGDGKVVVGAGEDGVYCFELEPKKLDANGQAVPLWHLPGSKYYDAEASPVIHEGKVYFGLGLDAKDKANGQAVCCVNLATGEELWRVRTDFPVFSAPAIAGGKLYVGMGTGDYVNSAEQLNKKPAGQVWCIDLDSHEVDWKFDQIGRTVLGAVAALDDRIYFGSEDSHVYCVSADGQLLKKQNLNNRITASVAVGQAHVYCQIRSGSLYALDRQSLDVVWKLDLNDTSNFSGLSSPSVARGHVYVGTDSHGLVCAGEPAGAATDAPWTGQLGGPGKTGVVPGSLASERGRFAWRYPPQQYNDNDEPLASEPAEVRATPAYFGGQLYFHLREGQRHRVVALKTGGVRAETVWSLDVPEAVGLFTADDAAVYCTTAGDADTTPPANATLYRIDRATGKISKSASLASPIETLVLAGGRIYAGHSGGGVTAYDCQSLDALWTAKVGSLASMPLSVDDIVYVETRLPRETIALDAQSGAILWRIAQPAAPAGEEHASPYVSRLVECRECLSLAKAGSSNPPVPFSGSAIDWTNLARHKTHLLANDADGNTLVVEPASHKELFRLGPIAQALFPPLIVDNTLYYLTLTDIQYQTLPDLSKAGEKENPAVENANAPAHSWCRTGWLGTPTTPPIMVDSDLYFGTKTRGLVRVKPSKR